MHHSSKRLEKELIHLTPPGASVLRRLLLVLVLLGAAAHTAWAQAPPTWQFAVASGQQPLGKVVVRATTVTSGGDVYVAGSYTGTATFGAYTATSSSLSSDENVFAAKWSTATQAWAWLVSGGGTGTDQALGIAVSGTSVYVTGYFTNSSGDANSVRFGTTVLAGASATVSTDAFLLKYTDNGTSATLGWTATGGGTSDDRATGVAANGLSVYVAGYFTNSSSDANSVRFGTTVLAGTSAGASLDAFLVKFTDNGAFATLPWTAVGGGTGSDRALGLAVSGTIVYLTGASASTIANTSNVRFSGNAVPGASSTGSDDAFLVRYTDAGASATYNWGVTGGGTSTDWGQGVAVSGTSVYVTGFVGGNSTNITSIRFGGTLVPGASTSNSNDMFLARYTDNNNNSATYNWAVTGGGKRADVGSGVAVSGTSVYVTGTYQNNDTNTSTVQFGGTTLNGVSTSSLNDVFVARYTASGTAAPLDWAVAGGGRDADLGMCVAVNGLGVYVGGGTGAPYPSGSELDIGAVLGTKGLSGSTGFVGQLTAATGACQTIIGSRSGDAALVRSTAVNAAGDVLVAGTFVGESTFGTTRLTSAGQEDIFVAKWSTASQSWAWAVRGGGSYSDYAYEVRVSGPNVYVTGHFYNNSSDTYAVRFGGVALPGASATPSDDVFLAKYTDNGASASFGWAVAGGGTGSDVALGLDVNGANLYLCGRINNNAADANAVRFGGVALPGTSTGTAGDAILVAKYVDNGASASYGWAIANSTGGGQVITVSGNAVYVGGNASGTYAGVPVSNGFIAKHVDNGTTASFGWAVTSSGRFIFGLSVVGTSVYASGGFSGSSIAKFTDNGTSVTQRWGWTGVPGNSPYGISARGTSVYVTGDNGVYVAKFNDNGASSTQRWVATTADGAWYGTSLDLRGTMAYVGGSLYMPATFGAISVAGAASNNRAFLAGLFVDNYPTALALSSTTIAENTGPNSPVGTLSTTDPDAGDTFTYTLVSGAGSTDNAAFTIANGNELRIVASPDFETKSSYAIRVRVGDNDDLAYEDTFTISVTNVNEAPTALALSNSVVAENTGVNAVVGTLSTTDPDAADIFTYTLVSGAGSTDNALVNISGNQVRLTASPDYEAQSSYAIRVLATDAGGLWVEQTFTITVTNVVETPTLTGLSPTSGPVGATVTLTGTFFQGAGPVTVSFNGTVATSLSVTSATSLTVTVPAGATSGPVTVTVADGTSTGLTFTVIPPPTLTALSPASGPEGTVVTLMGTNLGGATAVTFNGTAAASFTVVDATTIRATVAVGTITGGASVTTGGGSATTGATTFTVLPIFSGPANQCRTLTPVTSTGSGEWQWLLDAATGELVVGLNDQGHALGQVGGEVYRHVGPVRADPSGREFLNRNWHLTALNGFAGQQVQLRFYALNSEFAAYVAANDNDGNDASTLTDLRLTQYDGANEDCALANNASASTATYRLVTPGTPQSLSGAAWFGLEAAVSNHFSEFYVHGGTEVTLPVTLVAFEATRTGGAVVHVKWRTAQERQSAGFVVERSSDGRTFGPVSELLAGAGTSLTSHEYAFADAMAPAGQLYYRLRQQDTDGTAQYSAVVAVRAAAKGRQALALWPNPASVDGGSVRVTG